MNSNVFEGGSVHYGSNCSEFHVELTGKNLLILQSRGHALESQQTCYTTGWVAVPQPISAFVL